MLDNAPPPATRDRPPVDLAQLHDLRDTFARTAAAYGFRQVSTPFFERADLFTARSGPEIRNSLLTFHCDHEEYALRPEMTAPVCRMVASGAFDDSPRPYKLFYIAPCFRYCSAHSGLSRELTQAGIELFGDGSPAADAEVIAAGHRFLRNIGMDDLTVTVGSAGIFRALLPEGLTDDERASVIGHLDRLAGVSERCADALARKDPLLLEYLRNDRRDLAAIQRRSDYEGEHSISSVPAPGVDGLLERLPDEAAATYRHLWSAEGYMDDTTGDLLVQASRLRGSLDEVAAVATRMLSASRAGAPLGSLISVCRKLEQYSIGDFRVSLGIARGLTFYTGTVFEISSGASKLCGGGRYDGLVELFGGEPLPATGCAVRLDAIQGQRPQQGGQSRPAGIVLQPSAESDESAAITLAEALRDRGVRVGAVGARVATVSGGSVRLPGGRSLPADPDAILTACGDLQ